MTAESSHNLTQSIHQRLKNKARERKEDPNLVLIRYALERFLYRLGCSQHKDRFILKGAMLFAAWTGQPHRPTRDLDLLGMGDSSDEALMRFVAEIACMEVEPDGLEFDGHGISVSEIREAQDYPGKRIKLPARLGNARLNLQIDVGFGDAVTPEPAEIEYPVLLDLPAPRIRAYSCETVIAEKFQALVAFDMAISRMKDFYDIWILSKQFSFEGTPLSTAIAATFNRRGTAISEDVPTALTDEFAADRTKQTQWMAFLNRSGLTDALFDLHRVVWDLRTFLLEPLHAAAQGKTLSKSWTRGGPWI
ncbi:nucleotidyl transferase AbiEii/AbiGii toxin family protein [Anaerobaca lacustris]|uniref:Nucleotidyl transferase AbiEii/AbiGii toxin family protein n=1 Tax=Anaerobaca lacustris TaxID=3044600 RepID=A0AAW6U5H2_9BACT|nr:nucleotidyl transferase AbiEii/AbiGii toxin family protein [Sedimentisphaerales bacterium M17dextr]